MIKKDPKWTVFLDNLPYLFSASFRIKGIKNGKKCRSRIFQEYSDMPNKTWTWTWHFAAVIYLLKVNKRNTKTRCEICSSVSTVNFEHVNADWVTSNFRNNTHDHLKSKKRLWTRYGITLFIKNAALHYSKVHGQTTRKQSKEKQVQM